MTVLKEGATVAQMGTLMGAMTLVFTAALVGWVVWTWWPSRRALMDTLSRLPLEED